MIGTQIMMIRNLAAKLNTQQRRAFCMEVFRMATKPELETISEDLTIEYDRRPCDI